MLRIKGVGPVYVGWEAQSNEPKGFSWAWFRELTPPWRMGHGVRLRIGDKALQIGRCRKQPLADDPSALTQLGGYDLAATPDEIGRWGQNAAPPEERPPA